MKKISPIFILLFIFGLTFSPLGVLGQSLWSDNAVNGDVGLNPWDTFDGAGVSPDGGTGEIVDAPPTDLEPAIDHTAGIRTFYSGPNGPELRTLNLINTSPNAAGTTGGGNGSVGGGVVGGGGGGTPSGNGSVSNGTLQSAGAAPGTGAGAANTRSAEETAADRKASYLISNPLGGQTTSLSQVIANIVGIVQILLIMASVLFILWAGIQFVTARGDSGKIKNARNALLWGFVGIALILGAQVIVEALKGSVNSILK